ncbi:MAG TPA: hemerythrin domain-containing protein, partial [Methanomicrobiales archaeon]|nr:hemerythrin domain-containing protein [Methanomicrobiales archaeon]
MAENILDILTRQHNEVLSGLSVLFQKQTASKRGSRNEEYERVQSAFFKHAYGEEQVFYPKLRESMPHIINQAVDEHNIVRNQMR